MICKCGGAKFPSACLSQICAGIRMEMQTCMCCVLSVSTLSRFDEIRKADRASAQRLAAEKHSSSSSEDDEDEGEGKRGKILQSALCPYTSDTGGAYMCSFFR